MSSFFKKYGAVNSTEEIIYSFIEMRSFTSAVREIIDDILPLVECGAIKAQSMVDFVCAVKEFSQSELYCNINDWLERLDTDLKSICSVTLGANLNAQLQIIEIGIVSFNKEPYVEDGLLNAIFRDKTPSRQFRCDVSLGIHETKKLLGSKSVAVNREFFDGMNILFKSSLQKLRTNVTEAFNNEALALMGIENDLKFIVDLSKYILEIREKIGTLVFPEPAEYTDIRGLSNPALLNKCPKGTIVPNDIYMDYENRSFVLTGPNSGGKTVYVHSVTIAQLMFQLGLPIPARSAKMKIFDTIAAMYVHSSEKSNDGRLADEVKRLKECLSKLTKNSLLLLDETFSGTSAFDGVFLAESLIKYLYRHDIYHIYITHFHELSSRIDSLRQDGFHILMLSAQNIDGKRTYKIVPNKNLSSENSLARDIVAEHGLGFLFES